VPRSSFGTFCRLTHYSDGDIGDVEGSRKMRVCATFLIFIALLVPVGVSAQTGSGGSIARDQAEAIARNNGVVRITESERKKRTWKIEGRDQSGQEIEIRIDARTGAVVKVEHDD
jgi:hypothetical protein